MSTMAENQSRVLVEHAGLACKEILGKWLTYPLPPLLPGEIDMGKNQQ